MWTDNRRSKSTSNNCLWTTWCRVTHLLIKLMCHTSSKSKCSVATTANTPHQWDWVSHSSKRKMVLMEVWSIIRETRLKDKVTEEPILRWRIYPCLRKTKSQIEIHLWKRFSKMYNQKKTWHQWKTQWWTEGLSSKVKFLMNKSELHIWASIIRNHLLLLQRKTWRQIMPPPKCQPRQQCQEVQVS